MLRNHLTISPKSSQRRPIPEPQLATLIDVLSILIIFLIAGTVFGTSSLKIPDDLILPKSQNNEDLVSAPQILLDRRVIRLSFSGNEYPLSVFSPSSLDTERPAAYLKLQADIAGFLKGRRPEDLNAGSPVNFVADSQTPYKTLFDVVKTLRDLGLETLLFVSTAEIAK